MTTNRYLSHVHGVTFPEPERKPSEAVPVAHWDRPAVKLYDALDGYLRRRREYEHSHSHFDSMRHCDARDVLIAAIDAALAGKERP